MRYGQLVRGTPIAPISVLGVLLGVLGVGGCGSAPRTRDAAGKPDGARIYQIYCEGCHGPDGRRGEGPMQLIAGLDQTDEQLKALIRNGRGGMPAWRDRLKDDEVDAVLAYVKRFP